ncbi:hypothetical protein JCM8208_004278 [Rhodotorula glutinis]
MTSHLVDRFAKRALASSPRRSSSSPPLGVGNPGDDDHHHVAAPARPPGAAPDDCGFCAIVSGQESAHVVYDDEHVLAFLDILPIRPGHLLVVPRQHYERIPHLPDDLAAHLGRVLPRLCRALCRATGQPDHNLVSNQGYAQVVPHAHIHIIPAPTLSSPSSSSFADAARPATPPSLRRLMERDELDDAEGAEMARRIREELRREEDERAHEGEGPGARGSGSGAKL